VLFRSLHDLPAALRVLLAAVGGYLISNVISFIFPSVGLLFVAAAVLLGDDYQRSFLATAKRGKKGGTVALLGIDGSGKTTHAEALRDWVEGHGYRYSNVPFHRYLFVGALSGEAGVDLELRGRRHVGNPLRPALSLLDNLMLIVTTGFGAGLGGRVVVYDRYIWSTYLKYKALGYPVRPLSAIYHLPRPTRAIVLDIPVSKSLDIIDERRTHIRYESDILTEEREEYLRMARNHGYQVVDATRSFAEVQSDIERGLGGVFPKTE
jgi:dTMP kinase